MAKSKRKKLRDKLDDLLKQICRARDGMVCQKCGKAVEGSNAHTAHIKSKGAGGLMFRYDLLNTCVLCFHCHQKQHQGEWNAMEWLKETFPARHLHLKWLERQPIIKYSDSDLEEKIVLFKEILKGLQ